MGNRRSCRLGGTGRIPPGRDDDVYLTAQELGRERWEPLSFSLGRKPIDAYVFSLDVVKLAQTLAERLDAARDT